MTLLREVAVTPGDEPDPDDLAGLFDRYGAELLRYCARRVGPDHAEDVVAETFLTAHAQRHRFDRGRSRALPWLYGIATNLLRRHGRNEVYAYRALARAYGQAGRDDTGAEADRAAERADAHLARRRLARALAGLPRRQRDVLLLFAVAELEYAEIAQALDIPIGTVQSALHRARTKVRVALGANPVEGPSVEGPPVDGPPVEGPPIEAPRRGNPQGPRRGNPHGPPVVARDSAEGGER